MSQLKIAYASGSLELCEIKLVAFAYYIKMKCTDRLDSLNKQLETVSPFIKLAKAKQFQQQDKWEPMKT